MIVERVPCFEHGMRDGAIKQAGIKKGQAIMLGQCLGDGAFARSCRAIDGDYHSAIPECFAASFRARSALKMPKMAIAIQTTSNTIVGKL